MNCRLIICSLLLLLSSFPGRATDSLKFLLYRPQSARLVTTDDLGNIYTIHTNNILARYNSRGDSTGFYRSTLNGDIAHIDATNPLKLLLYYPAFNKVVFLDRQLAMKAEVDLRKLSILSATAVATASDGNLWVYDPLNAKLLKLDETGTELSSGIDLRQQLSFVPGAQFLIERDRKVYLCDTLHGILVFDQFATYITTLPFPGIEKLQAFDQQLVFYAGHTLHSYDMQTAAERIIPLPGLQEDFVDLSMSRYLIALLQRNGLSIYSWSSEGGIRKDSPPAR